jgi:hypothetical protein
MARQQGHCLCTISNHSLFGHQISPAFIPVETSVAKWESLGNICIFSTRYLRSLINLNNFGLQIPNGKRQVFYHHKQKKRKKKNILGIRTVTVISALKILLSLGKDGPPHQMPNAGMS